MSSQDAKACPVPRGQHGRVYFARIQGDRGHCGRGRFRFFSRQAARARRAPAPPPQLASGTSSASAAAVDASTATSAAAFGGMNGLIAAAKKEGQLNVITLPSNWANYGAIMKAFNAMYGIKITDANPEGSSANEISAINELKGKSTAPDVVDVGSSFAVSGDTSGLWAPVQGRDLERHPGRGQGRQRRLLRRLRRLRGHRLRPVEGEDPADVVQVAAQPDLQEPGRDRRRPDPDRLRVRRRLRGRARQRRLAVQHRPRRRLLQAAEVGRQLRPDRGHPGHRAVRCQPRS